MRDFGYTGLPFGNQIKMLGRHAREAAAKALDVMVVTPARFAVDVIDGVENMSREEAGLVLEAATIVLLAGPFLLGITIAQRIKRALVP